jgi:outer membrane protein assembly factor BamB
MELASYRNTVVYQRPTARPGDGNVTAVAVDGSTGHRLWSYGTDLQLVDNIEFCNGNRQICLNSVDYDGSNYAVVLNAATGYLLNWRQLRATRSVGTELYDQPPGRLARNRLSGVPVWSHPLSQLFPGMKVSTDHGWNIIRDNRRYVGTVAGVIPEHGTTTVRRLPASTSAFRISDGKRLWTRPGVAIGCNSAFAVSMTRLVGCRMVGGTITYSGRRTLYRHFQLEIDGLDPATGRTRWRWNAGAADIMYGDKSLTRLSANRYVIVSRTGRRYLVDLATGVQPYHGNSIGWCNDWTYVTPAVSVSWFPRAEESYPAGDVRPCDVAGHRRALPTSRPSFAVTRSGAVSAWSQADGVHASAWIG